MRRVIRPEDLCNAARVQAGSSVAVIGCGGVGLNVIQAARIAGARRMVAVDINPGRFARAEQMGATAFLVADGDAVSLAQLRPQLIEIGGGRACDYAFECTGNPALGAAPLSCVRNGGPGQRHRARDQHRYDRAFADIRTGQIAKAVLLL